MNPDKNTKRQEGRDLGRVNMNKYPLSKALLIISSGV